MSNGWIEHNGGPQPVDDNVWVEVNSNFGVFRGLAEWFPLSWEEHGRYRILNQHLIDAALKRGIELGLDAAAAEVWRGALGGLSLEEGANVIRNLNPDTIAKEAQHD